MKKITYFYSFWKGSWLLGGKTGIKTVSLRQKLSCPKLLLCQHRRDRGMFPDFSEVLQMLIRWDLQDNSKKLLCKKSCA